MKSEDYMGLFLLALCIFMVWSGCSSLQNLSAKYQKKHEAAIISAIEQGSKAATLGIPAEANPNTNEESRD